jgi:threonylcarbamoyladenosine tRNA methylthiotransferase MtaB
LRAVVEEVRRLADAGYRECVLTGANLGCYSDRGLGLVDLLARLADVPGIERIRLSSIEMSTAERAVIDFAVGCPKVCRCLHIPLQSGDDGVLGAMGRRYTAAGYRELAAYAADLLPACGLGTDVIVGFPGEDETAFANTLALLRDLPFTRLHVFPFSPRPGTRAADMPGQVPAVEKKRRAAAVAVLGRQKERAFTERWIGRPVSVIVERVTRHGGCGWTGEYVAARVPPAPDVRRGSLVTFVPADAEDDVLVASP